MTTSTAAPPGRPPLEEIADGRVVPLRRPGRWVATVIVLILLVQFAHGFLTNQAFEWARFRYWFARPVILQGLVLTLKVTALSAVFGFLGGVVLALGRLSRSPLLRAVSWTYIWLFRSIPLIVLLLLIYNFSALYHSLSLGLPFGPSFATFNETDLFSATTIAVVGLSLNEAAYAAEVVRAGVLSVDQGQWEAAHALGLPKARQFRRIVLPQAVRAIIPSYVNQLIGLLKGTSIIFYVSLLDLFGEVESLQSTYPSDIIPLLIVATVYYVLLTSILSIVQYYVERYYSRGALRTVPPTPIQRLRAALREFQEKATQR